MRKTAKAFHPTSKNYLPLASDKMSNTPVRSRLPPLGAFAVFGALIATGFSLFNWGRIRKLEKKKCPRAESSDDESNLALDDRLDVYETRVTLLEKKLASMASHEKRISSLGVRVSEMQDFGQRIFQVEHQDRQHGDTVREVEKRVDKLEKESGNHERKLRTHGQRLQRMEMEKPVYTFFPGPSNGTHTGPNGVIQGILGTVNEPGVIISGNITDSDSSRTPSPKLKAHHNTPETLSSDEDIDSPKTPKVRRDSNIKQPPEVPPLPIPPSTSDLNIPLTSAKPVETEKVNKEQ